MASQESAQQARNLASLLIDLSPCESNDLEPEHAKPVIPRSVGLERRTCPVGCPAVELRNEMRSVPKEIHDELINANVHFRLGKTVTPDQGKEPGLELAACVVDLQLVAGRKSKLFGLAERRPEYPAGEGAPEVLQRPSWPGDRDVFPTRAVVRRPGG